MSGLLWLLLGAALSAVLGIFVLRRRTRTERDLTVTQQPAVERPPKEGAVVERPGAENAGRYGIIDRPGSARGVAFCHCLAHVKAAGAVIAGCRGSGRREARRRNAGHQSVRRETSSGDRFRSTASDGRDAGKAQSDLGRDSRSDGVGWRTSDQRQTRDSGGVGNQPELRCHACADRRDPESSQCEGVRCASRHRRGGQDRERAHRGEHPC